MRRNTGAISAGRAIRSHPGDKRRVSYASHHVFTRTKGPARYVLTSNICLSPPRSLVGSFFLLLGRALGPKFVLRSRLVNVPSCGAKYFRRVMR